MEFKDKVFEARMQLGLSQEAFAKELHVGFVTLNRWEKGITTPQPLKERAFNDYCKSKGIEFKD